MEISPDAQLEGFLRKFTPDVEAKAREALTRMRARLPGAVELVYDNYNALAIGFGANETMAGLVFSIAVYPRWVSLFFARGIELPDPEGLLRGSGSKLRHIVLVDPTILAEPRVETLIAAALTLADPKVNPAAKRRIIIRSVSAKQRPRRPG